MKEIVEHILQKTNRDERGNVLAYKILCNIAIDMVKGGAISEAVIKYIDTLVKDLDYRKL